MKRDDLIEATLGADSRGPIHLLLTDMVMPGMVGHEVADEVAPIRPEMRVIYMSGYVGFTPRGVLDSDESFLPKPFTQEYIAPQGP